MQTVVPALRISKYEVSKQFYVDCLGFSIDWEHRFEEHFPVFMSITREGLSIYLTEHTGDCQVGGLAHFYVPDVDQWHRDFVLRNAPIDQLPEESIPGLRMMQIIDPDGNKLRVATRLNAG